jgi:hypothetical protein
MKLNQGDYSDLLDKILTLLVAEYQALRSQILEQVKSIYVILTALAPIIAGAFAGGTALWEKALASTVIFNVAIPLILLIAAIGIMFALKDMMTLGRYIKNQIEDRAEALLGKELKELLKSRGYSEDSSFMTGILGWEKWLREPGTNQHRLIDGNTGTFTVVFIFLFIITTTLGELRVYDDEGWVTVPCTLRILLAIFPLIILSISVILVYLMYRRLKRI